MIEYMSGYDDDLKRELMIEYGYDCSDEEEEEQEERDPWEYGDSYHEETILFSEYFSGRRPWPWKRS